MQKRYIIVSPYASVPDREFMQKLNRKKGGIGGYNQDTKLWIGLVFVLFAAWFIVPSDYQPLNMVLFLCAIGCGAHVYANHHGHEMVVRKGNLLVTTDIEIIALDHEWLKYIAELPQDERQDEDMRRFVAVRRLNETPVSVTRTEEIWRLRRKVQERDKE